MTTLADAGVREAVVSPGSRSTPLVLALAAEPRIRLADVIDERAAAFLALGIARSTGVPALLVCTSGTALAHYLPAVIEASESGVPLIALSADRPAELHDAAANQTIRQAHLYGSFVRWSVDLGVPEADEHVLRALRRRVLQAVRAACADKPGPVHLNAPTRKPLEPPATFGPDERALDATIDGLLHTSVAPVTAPIRPAAPTVIDLWAAFVAAAGGRGLIACGPGAAESAVVRDAVLAFAGATGFPVLAEAASGLRFCGSLDTGIRRIGAVDTLLGAGLGSERVRPAVVVQVGRPLVAGGWERVAALPGVRLVVSSWDWPDPEGTAVSIVQADPGPLLDEVRARVLAVSPGRDDGWASAWTDLDRQALAAADALVAAEGEPLCEAAVVRALLEHVPDDGLLGLGNSLPVRHVDAWVAPTDRHLRVLVQRGASGIDGLVAGMVGAHRVAARPAALLVGDVSFVHDLGALAVTPLDGPPLVILVLDNRGGRIFERLPVAKRAPDAMGHFITPPRVDLALATRAFGIVHVAVERRAELDTELRAAFRRSGTTVIQARVPPHGATEMHDRLAARVAEVVRGYGR